MSVNNAQIPFEALTSDIPDFAFDVDFEYNDDRKELKFYRVAFNSLEVSPDGRFFANESQDSSNAKDLHSLDVKQHELTDGSLESEVTKFIDHSSGKDQLRVIVTADTKYEYLLRIMEAAFKQKLAIAVLVRENRFLEKYRDSPY